MSRINFMGSYSGIDGSQIDALMEAEKMPIVHMSNKKTSLEEKQNAWKDINTRLNSLFDKAKALSTPSTFASKKATSTNDDFVSMSVSNSAADADYRVNVKQLATNSRVMGKRVEAADIGEDGKLEKTGKFTITNADGKAATIEVEEDSLKDIAEKINAASLDSKDAEGKIIIEGTGIRATVIDNTLILEDTKAGDRMISVTDGKNGLAAYLGMNNEKIVKGQTAIVTVNGIKIERDTNTISDAIEGVTINLKKAHAKKAHAEDPLDTEVVDTEVVTVATDFSKAEKAIQEFVDQYNSTMNFMKEQSKAGDPEVKGSGGKLSGDSSLIALEAKLRRVVGDSMNIEGSEINTASKLGISTFDRYGDLTFDASKFRKEIRKDPDSVVEFFSAKDKGFVAKVNKQIDGYISKNNGIIKSKNEGFDRSLKRLNGDIDRFNERMERREEYYIKMFSRLDVAMMQAESQMQWLVGQVDAMNAQR